MSILQLSGSAAKFSQCVYDTYEIYKAWFHKIFELLSYDQHWKIPKYTLIVPESLCEHLGTNW